MAGSDDDILSVDIEELERGGVHLTDIAHIAVRIYNDVNNAVTQFPHPGGDGDIGDSVRKNYEPSAQASLEFLKNVKELLGGHGSQTLDLSGLFGDVNDVTTIDAGGHGRH